MLKQSPAAYSPARNWARPAFTLTVFVSAFLLFAIQPMFTKMVLPQLGGSPGVWSVAMVFFQGLLLLGYLYAHLSSTYLPTRVAVLLHIVILLITFISLPIAVSSGLGKPPVEGQIFWLIGVFMLSVGLPFFAVAGNGPLLQAWFARTGHKDASDPYFLYAASNLGSFAALLLYPVLFEITLRLPQQAFAWSAGFAALIACIAASGFITTQTQNSKTLQSRAISSPLTSKSILQYIGLAFVPSALLVAVTSHIATDVASAPFIWIVPLALFLLTFVLIFTDKPLVPLAVIYQAVPILAGGILLSKLYQLNFVVNIIIHIGFFFSTALMYHHLLYTLRPEAKNLTKFYLWMSFGGVLGGIFSGLLAPYIFNSILEYPILVSVVMLAHPSVLKATKQDWKTLGLPALLVAASVTIVFALLQKLGWTNTDSFIVPAIIIGTFFVAGAFRHNIIRAVFIPFTFLLLALHGGNAFGTKFMRSFFGVDRISIEENGQFRVLSHGTTVHGATRIANADGTVYSGSPIPLSYYHPEGVLAQTLKLLPDNPTGRDVGIVGLGAGAQVCNGKPNDRFTYFEIDSLVAKIATDKNEFQFLSACAPNLKIVLGDARLTLQDQPQQFDYLLLDAFSSDSIPTHLLTREALQIYSAHLKPNGLLVFHISNRHMELETVVAALAKDAGLFAKDRLLVSKTNSLADPYSSEAMIMAKSADTLAQFTTANGWTDANPKSTAVWTDDYSNIPASIWRKYWKDGE